MSLFLCNVQGCVTRGVQVLLFEMPDSLKFQILLIYATDSSNVHVHVIQGTCTEGGQVWHFHVVTPLENWSHLEVQGVFFFKYIY